MLLVWFVAFLAIMLSFLVKLNNRKDKNTPLNLKFWIRDNAPELLISALSMIILLILVGKTEFDTTNLMAEHPLLSSLPMDLIVAALVGYLNNTLWYWLVSMSKKQMGMKK